MNKTAFAWGRLAAIDPDAVFEAAGIVRNAPTASESTPRDLEATPPGEWASTEWGATATPRPAREADELRHVPAQDRNSVEQGKRGDVREELGGARHLKKK